jgi:hypothetical protein
MFFWIFLTPSIHPSIHPWDSFIFISWGGKKCVSLSTTDDNRANVLRFIDPVIVTSVGVSLYDRPFFMFPAVLISFSEVNSIIIIQTIWHLLDCTYTQYVLHPNTISSCFFLCFYRVGLIRYLWRLLYNTGGRGGAGTPLDGFFVFFKDLQCSFLLFCFVFSWRICVWCVHIIWCEQQQQKIISTSLPDNKVKYK